MMLLYVLGLTPCNEIERFAAIVRLLEEMQTIADHHSCLLRKRNSVASQLLLMFLYSPAIFLAVMVIRNISQETLLKAHNTQHSCHTGQHFSN